MNKEILEKRYIEEQNILIKKIDLKNIIHMEDVHLLAGIDLAYWNKENEEYAVCCIVIIDCETRQVIEKKYKIDRITIPYIPGCLAFREIPLFLKTKELLENEPDVFMFDGNGYLHARHMGLATHAGILIDKPTIGVAKSYYKIGNVDYCMPNDEKYAYEDIVIDSKIYGRVLRTKKNVKPIFVSTGNKIDIDTAMNIVIKMVIEESRIPLPIRAADIMTHEIRKRYA